MCRCRDGRSASSVGAAVAYTSLPGEKEPDLRSARAALPDRYADLRPITDVHAPVSYALHRCSLLPAYHYQTPMSNKVQFTSAPYPPLIPALAAQRRGPPRRQRHVSRTVQPEAVSAPGAQIPTALSQDDAVLEPRKRTHAQETERLQRAKRVRIRGAYVIDGSDIELTLVEVHEDQEGSVQSEVSPQIARIKSAKTVRFQVADDDTANAIAVSTASPTAGRTEVENVDEITGRRKGKALSASSGGPSHSPPATVLYTRSEPVSAPADEQPIHYTKRARMAAPPPVSASSTSANAPVAGTLHLQGPAEISYLQIQALKARLRPKKKNIRPKKNLTEEAQSSGDAVVAEQRRQKQSALADAGLATRVKRKRNIKGRDTTRAQAREALSEEEVDVESTQDKEWWVRCLRMEIRHFEDEIELLKDPSRVPQMWGLGVDEIEPWCRFQREAMKERIAHREEHLRELEV